MAVIISPYVGDARGKLGEGVFMRSKGQTIVRGYNPSPLNRRTQSQQAQRAVFSAAVKFFSRGVQNLFHFAFETKPTKESDYNAFMRLNAKKGIYFGPAENSNEAFPALGPWSMTRGSLKGAAVEFDTLPRIYFPGIDTAPSRTIGALSQAILESDANYEPGDILTFVNIGMWITPGSPSYPFERVPDEVPDWNIYQIVLDTSDTTPLPADDWFYQVSPDDGLGIWPHQAEVPTAFCGACCFVHSRVRNGKVYVSNSDLALNGLAATAYSYGRSDTWRAVVMAAWGTEQESILQGAIAARQRPAGVSVELGFTPPESATDIADGSVFCTISGEHSVSDIVQHLQISNEESEIYDGVAEGGSIEYFINQGEVPIFDLQTSIVGGNTVCVYTGNGREGVIQSVAWVE